MPDRTRPDVSDLAAGWERNAVSSIAWARADARYGRARSRSLPGDTRGKRGRAALRRAVVQRRDRVHVAPGHGRHGRRRARGGARARRGRHVLPRRRPPAQFCRRGREPRDDAPFVTRGSYLHESYYTDRVERDGYEMEFASAHRAL